MARARTRLERLPLELCIRPNVAGAWKAAPSIMKQDVVLCVNKFILPQRSRRTTDRQVSLTVSDWTVRSEHRGLLGMFGLLV